MSGVEVGSGRLLQHWVFAATRPTLLPSMGGSRESLIRRQRTLALLNDRAEVVAHTLMKLDLSFSLWGVRIREIWEACFHLHKVRAQVENPLQWYRSAEEGTTSLRAALAVVEQNLDSNHTVNNPIGRDSRRRLTRRLCFSSTPSLPLLATRQTN